MPEPPVLLGKGCNLLLKRTTGCALGLDEAAQRRGRQGGEIDLLRSGHKGKHAGCCGSGDALVPKMSHAVAVGRRTRRGPWTRCHASPSNRASNCARDSRTTPSRIAGQANLPAASRLWTRTRSVPSKTKILIRSPRLERNTTITPACGSRPSWLWARAAKLSWPRAVGQFEISYGDYTYLAASSVVRRAVSFPRLAGAG